MPAAGVCHEWNTGSFLTHVGGLDGERRDGWDLSHARAFAREMLQTGRRAGGGIPDERVIRRGNPGEGESGAAGRGGEITACQERHFFSGMAV